MNVLAFCYVFVESAGGHGFEEDLRPDLGVFREEVFLDYVLPDWNLLALLRRLAGWLGGIFGFDVDVACSGFIGFDLLLPDEVFEDVDVEEHVLFFLVLPLLSIAGAGLEELCFC